MRRGRRVAGSFKSSARRVGVSSWLSARRDGTSVRGCVRDRRKECQEPSKVTERQGRKEEHEEHTATRARQEEERQERGRVTKHTSERQGQPPGHGGTKEEFAQRSTGGPPKAKWSSNQGAGRENLRRRHGTFGEKQNSEDMPKERRNAKAEEGREIRLLLEASSPGRRQADPGRG